MELITIHGVDFRIDRNDLEMIVTIKEAIAKGFELEVKPRKDGSIAVLKVKKQIII